MTERLNKHLHDALMAARLALQFADGMDLAAYRADALRRSAIERQMGIVGEACYDNVDHQIVLNAMQVHPPALVLWLEGELAGAG
jgi:uncharacterized protein with HEPN domain